MAAALCTLYFIQFPHCAIGATSGSIGSFFNEIGGLAVLWVGAYLVLEGQLTIGQLIARIISANVVGPIIRLAGTCRLFSPCRFN